MNNRFIQVPEIQLPNGQIVPPFKVGQFVCSQGEDGKVAITADGNPWVNINFFDAKAACEASGFKLITESQWLAIAWDVSQQACNWNTNTVGKGRLFQGLRNDSVDAAQPGSYEPEDPDEQRWLTLSNGERICDLNGNVLQWVFDDIQGDEAGLTTNIKADSPSLIPAPYPSLEKGMGWRPDGQRKWSGDALIRGGSWRLGAPCRRVQPQLRLAGRRVGQLRLPLHPVMVSGHWPLVPGHCVSGAQGGE